MSIRRGHILLGCAMNGRVPVCAGHRAGLLAVLALFTFGCSVLPSLGSSDPRIRITGDTKACVGGVARVDVELLTGDAGGAYTWVTASGPTSFTLGALTPSDPPEPPDGDARKATTTTPGTYMIEVTYTTPAGDSVTEAFGPLTFIELAFDSPPFEKSGVAKDHICAHTCSEAWSQAMVTISPSSESVVYTIVGDDHGASINATGKITHDGSDDGGEVTIRAEAASFPACYAEESFIIKAHPVVITGSTSTDAPEVEIVNNTNGLSKIYTFSSSDGNVAHLDGIKVDEWTTELQDDIGSTGLEHVYDGVQEWTLDDTGTWTVCDDNKIGSLDVNGTDLATFPYIVRVAQRFAWKCTDCAGSSGADPWVEMNDDVIEIKFSWLKQAPTASGVIAFDIETENTSANVNAQVSNTAMQYYHGPRKEPYNLSISPSASSLTAGGQLAVTMSGMIGAYETDVYSDPYYGASLEVAVNLLDDDALVDDVLWALASENLVSAANGGVPSDATDKGTVIIPFSLAKDDALNQRRNGDVIGPDGSSGEIDAEIAFDIKHPTSASAVESPSTAVSGVAYTLPAPGVVPVPVPLGSTATVTMSGCAEATVSSGNMTLDLQVIDDDALLDDVLVDGISHTFAVPSGQIQDGLVSFSGVTATIENDGGTIKGATGSSGEGTASDPAEIAFEIDVSGSNPQSSTTDVTGVQP